MSPSKHVSVRNYKMYLENVQNPQQRQLNSVNRYLENQQKKALKLQVQMQKVLDNRRHATELKQIIQQQNLLKQRKKDIKAQQKSERQEQMRKQYSYILSSHNLLDSWLENISFHLKFSSYSTFRLSIIQCQFNSKRLSSRCIQIKFHLSALSFLTSSSNPNLVKARSISVRLRNERQQVSLRWQIKI